MDKDIINKYADIGITTPKNLYDYIISHDHVTLNDTYYDLTKSNEVMEFMANFLENNNYKVKRLFFEKNNADETNENNYHFIITWTANKKWYYSEPLIKILKNRYVFKSFDVLTNFIYSNLCNILGDGSLKEINKPSSTDLLENIEEAKNGDELLADKTVLIPRNYIDIDKPDEIGPRKEKIGNIGRYRYALITLGFVLTLAICIIVIYLLYQAKSG